MLVLCVCGQPTVWDQYHQTIALSEGQSFVLRFVNEPLDSPAFLWSYRYLHIRSIEPTSFHVYRSTSEAELLDVIQNPSDNTDALSHPQVEKIRCSHLFSATSSLEECSVTLNFYGEPEYGWIPRFNRFFSLPVDTHVAIVLPAGSYISNERALFTIDVTEEDESGRCLLLLALGLFFYTFSNQLSYSVKLYLLFWFLGGAFVGALTIVAFITYFASRALTKGGVGITNLLLMTFGGWAGMYYVDLIPSFAEVMQSKFWMSCMLTGAMIGLWYGYTARLSPLQKGRMSLMLKIASLLMIFWSFYQLEMALLICLFTLTNVPSSVIFYFLSWVLPSSLLPQPQGSAPALDPAVEAFRKEPQLLAGLSLEERERVLTLLGDEHLRVVYEPIFVDNSDREDESSSDESDLDSD